VALEHGEGGEDDGVASPVDAPARNTALLLPACPMRSAATTAPTSVATATCSDPPARSPQSGAKAAVQSSAASLVSRKRTSSGPRASGDGRGKAPACVGGNLGSELIADDVVQSIRAGKPALDDEELADHQAASRKTSRGCAAGTCAGCGRPNSKTARAEQRAKSPPPQRTWSASLARRRPAAHGR